MVEADSHLKLLPTSTLDIYKVVMVEADSHHKLLPASKLDILIVFEHFDMLSVGIQ
jgi:hypothetical protein